MPAEPPDAPPAPGPAPPAPAPLEPPEAPVDPPVAATVDPLEPVVPPLPELVASPPPLVLDPVVAAPVGPDPVEVEAPVLEPIAVLAGVPLESDPQPKSSVPAAKPTHLTHSAIVRELRCSSASSRFMFFARSKRDGGMMCPFMARRQRSRQCLWTMACVLAASSAGANGRFPRSERLIEDPSDPNHLLLAATYGVLTTRDRGARWYHVCESAFSLRDGYVGDPLLDLGRSGALLVGVQTTLDRSRDGCDWTAVLGGGSSYVIDDAFAKSEPSTIVALLEDFEGGSKSYGLALSTDEGLTWAPLGAPLAADGVYTIDVDPRDASRLYATALVDNVGQWMASTDGGASWTSHPIPNTSIDEAPYLAAVHPLDPNKVFVRTDSWVPIDGALTAHDALLYSADGGITWTELFRSKAKLFGFALSPDGSEVLVGYGDPQPGAGQVVSGPFGVFKSSTDAFSFERVMDAHVGCLAWTAAGAYVCASQAFDGFELGFARGGDFGREGGALERLLLLDRVAGPLACDTATRGSVCAASWPIACATFGACRDAGARDGGPTGAMGAEGGSDASAGEVRTEGGGCACGVARRGPLDAAWVTLVGAMFAMRSLRRARAATTPREREGQP
jgi:hypothetical protein